MTKQTFTSSYVSETTDTEQVLYNQELQLITSYKTQTTGVSPTKNIEIPSISPHKIFQYPLKSLCYIAWDMKWLYLGQ